MTTVETAPVQGDIEPTAEAPLGPGQEPPLAPEEGPPAPPGGASEAASIRLAVALSFPVVGAAVMAGGIYAGIAPRIYAGVAGLLGVALGVVVSRFGRRPLLTYLAVVAGLFAIGALMVLPSGPGEVLRVHRLAGDAARTGNVLRPPVDFDLGWRAIIGWLMGTVGFAAVWLAVVVRRPSLGLLAPLPIAALCGISVPASAQVASGLAVLVLFAIGLGLLSSEQSVGDDESQRPPLAYELRKALKAIPLLALITVLLYVLSRTNALFPEPQINPAQEPQKPKTQPLSKVEDRVLFEVESEVTGPWRIGSLDVYDPKDGSWRLPPFAQNKLEEVPKSGVVDPSLQPGVRATFTVAGLGGTVLPDLPNTVGIRAEGPRLAYDSRNGNIRLVNGQVAPGQRYTVVAAALPSVEDLKATSPATVPRDIRQFTRIPKPPAAVQGLIAQATGASAWEKFDYVRTWILDNVTASGTGSPKSVTPGRVADMISGNRKGTPFEIVAAQAMLARWIGVPSRIGYGFDQGEVVNGKRQIRPSDGAAFVEVYFTGFKWLPVIGTPKKAEPTVGSDPSRQRLDAGVLPSDDIAVQIFLPTVIPPGSVLGAQILRIVSVAVPVLALLGLLYLLYPALAKALARGRRREAAALAGTRARIALAYAEWRDHASDFGFFYPTDTPLMFLDRFADDDEHTELAWLTTRALWGDLQDDPSPMLATVAEELSRALRRRLSAAQPGTMRAVALVSRVSMRDPYAPGTDLTVKKEPRRKERRRVVTPEPA